MVLNVCILSCGASNHSILFHVAKAEELHLQTVAMLLHALLGIGFLIGLCDAARPPTLDTTEPRKFEFTITKQRKDPSGFVRDFLVVNDQFPGPHLEINEGEDVEITVHNKLDVNTTIHWHGSSFD